ncbi:MAG: hypothetical protein KTR25_07280 [Myxococcales bacterium]|nr:hypothetical protein [Myxococcales bacterium]
MRAGLDQQAARVGICRTWALLTCPTLTPALEFSVFLQLLCGTYLMYAFSWGLCAEKWSCIFFAKRINVAVTIHMRNSRPTTKLALFLPRRPVLAHALSGCGFLG